MIPETIGGIFGATLAVGSGFLGFWLQSRYEGRHQFLAVTASIRAELDLAPHDSAGIFARSHPKLAHAIHLCRPHINQDQFDRLRATWRDYRHQNQDDLDPQKEQGLSHAIQTDKTAAEILSAYLDRLDDCVTKSA
jgi:hypothetical protein